ncbi:hypothetical protein [Methylomicrobium lacus]|uniref:hypothetical protein n=1 Tax=Methylomicrobium lacus TaxID=136992 RepID=UPI0035A8FC4D
MGQKLPPAQMDLYRRIDEILWREWDPIGVSEITEARDEYYGYLPIVFRLVLEGKEEEVIAQCLLSFEKERMGLAGNAENAKRVAGLVLREKVNLGV